jgi:hypothetical protein
LIPYPRNIASSVVRNIGYTWVCSQKSNQIKSIMNFYPAPPVINASLYLRIPDSIRCQDRKSEWRGGFSRPFQGIFLEGPVYTASGDLYVVDIPYGRILRITPEKVVVVEAEWDGEPNGLAVDPEGRIAIADYKQVRFIFSIATYMDFLSSPISSRAY